MDFTKKQCRVAMKFLFVQGKSAKEIFDTIVATLGNSAPLYTTVNRQVSRFRTEYFSTEDKERPGRPMEVTSVVENEDNMHDLVLENRRISAKSISETLNISRQRVGYILTKILDMRKVSAKRVPKCLNANEKRERVTTSTAILRHFETGDFF